MKRIYYYALAVTTFIATSGCHKNPDAPQPTGDKKIEIKTSIINENAIAGNTKAPSLNGDGREISPMEIYLPCMFCPNRVSLPLSSLVSASPIYTGEISTSIQRIIRFTFRHAIPNRS